MFILYVFLVLFPVLYFAGLLRAADKFLATPPPVKGPDGIQRFIWKLTGAKNRFLLVGFTLLLIVFILGDGIWLLTKYVDPSGVSTSIFFGLLTIYEAYRLTQLLKK